MQIIPRSACSYFIHDAPIVGADEGPWVYIDNIPEAELIAVFSVRGNDRYCLQMLDRGTDEVQTRRRAKLAGTDLPTRVEMLRQYSSDVLSAQRGEIPIPLY